MNIKSEFTQYCGPSVLYSSHVKDSRTLTVVYTIPALGEERYRVVAHLRNGLAIVLMRAVRQAAHSASDHAYRATGHRDADMKRLLQGKLV